MIKQQLPRFNKTCDKKFFLFKKRLETTKNWLHLYIFFLKDYKFLHEGDKNVYVGDKTVHAGDSFAVFR